MDAAKIVRSVTIAPNGSVTSCEVVSSSFDDGALLENIVQRVKLMNFGAKAFQHSHANHPLHFLPS